jgi:hypothetical protein
LCRRCDHFIEDNAISREGVPEPLRSEIAEYVHLDNGNKEHDHDAMPTGATLAVEWFAGVAMFLSDWRAMRPDLFIGHADGQIGPNSRFHRPLFRQAG